MDIEINKEQISLSELKKNISLRSNLDHEVLYILPDVFEKKADQLNPFTYEYESLFFDNEVNNKVIGNEKSRIVKYRSGDIILPIIYGIPFSIISSIIATWIYDLFINNSNKNQRITIRYVKVVGEKSEIVSISGLASNLVKVLKEIQKITKA